MLSHAGLELAGSTHNSTLNKVASLWSAWL